MINIVMNRGFSFRDGSLFKEEFRLWHQSESVCVDFSFCALVTLSFGKVKLQPEGLSPRR